MALEVASSAKSLGKRKFLAYPSETFLISPFFPSLATFSFKITFILTPPFLVCFSFTFFIKVQNIFDIFQIFIVTFFYCLFYNFKNFCKRDLPFKKKLYGNFVGCVISD